MNHLVLMLILTSSYSLFGQNLDSFKFSDCNKSDSIRTSEIKKISIQNNGLTTIDLRTYANCRGNFEGDIELLENFVNLMFQVKPVRIKQKDGSYSEIVELADCNCLFDFQYRISGIDHIGKDQIKVNGMTLTEIDEMNIGWEIKVE